MCRPLAGLYPLPHGAPEGETAAATLVVASDSGSTFEDAIGSDCLRVQPTNPSDRRYAPHELEAPATVPHSTSTAGVERSATAPSVLLRRERPNGISLPCRSCHPANEPFMEAAGIEPAKRSPRNYRSTARARQCPRVAPRVYTSEAPRRSSPRLTRSM